MTNPMISIVLFSLLACPLLPGGPSGDTARSRPPRGEGRADALRAAEYVLNSLQNWSAPGLAGACWIAAPTRKQHVEAMIRKAGGGAPPQVHVESIEVKLVTRRRAKDTAHFQVTLDLHIQAVDDLVIAATMLESFSETMDEYNGELGVDIGSTRLDLPTRSLHVPRLEIYLPATGDMKPSEDLSRPLTEITRCVSTDHGQISSLRVDSSQRVNAKKQVERTLNLQLGGDDPRLTVADCGAFLNRLHDSEAVMPITHLSLDRRRSEGENVEAWKLKATLRIGMGSD